MQQIRKCGLEVGFLGLEKQRNNNYTSVVCIYARFNWELTAAAELTANMLANWINQHKIK